MNLKGKPGEILGTRAVVLYNDTFADPAIDLESIRESKATPPPDVAYWRSADPSTLPMKDGQKPVFFTLARMPASYLATIMGDANIERRRMLAVLGSLRSVGREGEPPIIEVLPPRPAPPEGSRFVGTIEAGALVAPAELLQELVDLYGYESAQQLGAWAIDMARLPKDSRGPFSYWGR